MKPTAKLLNQPVTKKDVLTAVAVTLKTGSAETINLSRHGKLGYRKANKLSKLMYDAGVIVDSTFRGTVILLKNEQAAINAALRQFNKGKR